MYVDTKTAMHILYNQKLMRMELERVELEARRDAAQFPHIRKTYEAAIIALDTHRAKLQQAVTRRNVA